MSTRILYDLYPNKTYVVKVRAKAGSVAGPWSGPLYVTTQQSLAPETPSTPVASPGNRTITLNWTANSGNVVSYYEVYYQEGNGSFTPPGSGTLAGSTSGTSYTITALSNGTTYYIKIVAVSKDGIRSAPSASASATPSVEAGAGNLVQYQWQWANTDIDVPGTAIKNIQIVGSRNALYVRWDEINNPNGNIVYNLYLKTSNPQPLEDPNNPDEYPEEWNFDSTEYVGSTRDNFYTITRYPDGTRLSHDYVYYIRFTITTTGGEWVSTPSDAVSSRLESSVVTGIDSFIGPSVSPSITLIPGTDHILVNWTPVYDPQKVVSYEVYVATTDFFTYIPPTPGGSYANYAGETTGSSFIIRGTPFTGGLIPLLTSNTKYYVKIRAKVGNNAYLGASATVSAITAANKKVYSYVHAVIANTTASLPKPVLIPSSQHLIAMWDPIPNPNGTITYEIFLRTSDSGWTFDSTDKVGETSGSAFIIRTTPDGEPLQRGTTYYSKIRAIAPGLEIPSATGSPVTVNSLLYGSSDNDASSYSATVTWSKNKPLFAAIITRSTSGPIAPTSLYHGSLFFTKITDRFVGKTTGTSNDANMSLWYAANPPEDVTGGLIEWNMGSTHTASAWHFFQLESADTTSPVEGNPTSNSGGAGAVGVSTLTATLDPYVGTNDRPVMFAYYGQNAAINIANWTTVGDEVSTTAPVGRSEVVTRSSQDTTATISSVAGSANALGIIAIKTRAAPSSGDASYASPTSDGAVLEPIKADDLDKDIISADYLATDIALVEKSITVGDPSDQYVRIAGEEGISLWYGTQQLVDIPTDNTKSPYFSGNLKTQNLTVEGGMTLRGSNVMDKGSSITLNSKVQPPGAPVISIDWETVDIAPEYEGERRGLFYTAAGGADGLTPCWYMSVDDKALEINVATGTTNVLFTSDNPLRGLVRIDNYIYALAQRDSTGEFILNRRPRETLVKDAAFGSNGNGNVFINITLGEATLAVDSSFHPIVWTTNNNGLILGKPFDKTTGATRTVVTSNKTLTGNNASIRGAWYEGTNVWWVIVKTGGAGNYNSSTILKFTQTGSPASAATYDGVNSEWGTTHELFGITSLGGFYYTLKNNRKANKHTAWTWSGNKTYYIAYSWKDPTGPKITLKSSYSSIVMNKYKRARLAITTGTKPSEVTAYHIWANTSNSSEAYYQALNSQVTSETDITTYMYDYATSTSYTSTTKDNFEEGTSEIKTPVDTGMVIGGDGTFKLPKGAGSPPSAAAEAMTYYDSTDKAVYVHNGTAWHHGRPFIGARLYKDSAGSHTNTGNFQVVAFSTQDYDSGPSATNWAGIAQAADNGFKVPDGLAGIWTARGHIQFNANATGNRRELQIVKGATVLSNQVVQNNIAADTGIAVEWTGLLAVGDVIKLESFQNSGGNLDYDVGTSIHWFEIEYKGPLGDV